MFACVAFIDRCVTHCFSCLLLLLPLQAVLKEVSDSNGKIVLFIDEIHTVVGAGATGGAMDAGGQRSVLQCSVLRWCWWVVLPLTSMHSVHHVLLQCAKCAPLSLVHVQIIVRWLYGTTALVLHKGLLECCYSGASEVWVKVHLLTAS